MSKNYDTRKFNNFDFYNINEVADKLSVSPKTIRKWELEGLKMDRTQRPIYIHGRDLKSFLKEKNCKRRCKLSFKEFYCCKCHMPVDIIPASFKYKTTERQLGKKQNKQVLLQGTCRICGTTVSRFSSEQKLEKLKKEFL